MPVQSASYKNMDRLFIDTNVITRITSDFPCGEGIVVASPSEYLAL